MRAMVLREFGSPMVLEEVDTPSPKHNEALIRVGATGLCATDVKVVHGSISTVTLPVVPGHELAGQIVEFGADSDHTGFEVGDHVAIHIVIPCGVCKPCQAGMDFNCENAERMGYDRPGGFGEFVTVPLDRLVRVQRDVPMEHLSIITGTISTSYRALKSVAKIGPEQSVVIFGVGGLGIHAIQIASELGAEVIAVDIDDEKLELAGSLGAHLTINANQDVEKIVKAHTGVGGADSTVIFVGGPALETVVPQAFSVLRRTGRLVLVGYLSGVDLKVDTNDLVYMTWEVKGARSSTMTDLREAVGMVESGRVKPIISSSWQLSEANEALESLRVNPSVGRMVLLPDS